MAQIMLQQPWALLGLVLGWLLLLLFAWRRRFKPFGPFLLRLSLIVLVALALAQPVYSPAAEPSGDRPPEQSILLVDQSASLGEIGRQALRAEAARLLQEMPEAIPLFFADRPVLAPNLAASPAGNGEAAARPLNPESSNLAAALSMGAELIDEGTGRLLLLSDGLPTEGDALAVAARLARQGIPVDTFLPDASQLNSWSGGSNEIHLARLTVPPVLRQGEIFDIEVTVHAEQAGEVTLRLFDSSQGNLLAEDVVSLEPGFNFFTFEATADRLGLQTFRAAVAAVADGQPANNSFSAVTQVYPPPRVLLVSTDLLPASRFAVQLDGAGFETSQIGPAELPDRLSELEPYDGMVLLNVSARDLDLEQMIAVQEFVRSLGRGLLVTGGRQSFSLGNYEDTPLADLLPVSLEPPPREERPPVALLLMIDHSGSMIEEDGGATKLAMAKEAAIRATDILGPDDLIGILIFDNRYEWVVPFQTVDDGAALLQIQQAIATIPGGGGTRILQALGVGLPAMAEQEAVSVARHVVLLSDGRSFDGSRGLEDYDLLVDAAQEAEITLSTIAIGNNADQDLLMHLAERGRGRYHFAAVPDELPELTIAESDILRSTALQEGEYRPSVFKPHPILRGLFTILTAEGQLIQDVTAPDNQMPDLTGYIALSPKPRAEIALQLGPGNPLLTVWGYGLGRVAAWASDTGQEWSSDLYKWPKATRFWGQVVGYTLPEPDLGLLQLEAVLEPNNVVTLVADSVSATGQPVDLTPTQTTLIGPGGGETGLSLRQVAPGRYEQRLHLPDPGAYQLSVTQPRSDAPAETATIGFVMPYPAEYGLPADNAGQALLEQIAQITGGHTLGLGESLPPETVAGELTGPSSDPLELWPWLLQVALILWPIEIAWRRWARLRIQ